MQNKKPSVSPEIQKELSDSQKKPTIHGLIVKSGKSDWLKIQSGYSVHAQKIGSSQVSIFGTGMLTLQTERLNSLYTLRGDNLNYQTVAKEGF